MTKVKAKVKFLDKFDNSIVYTPGSIIEIDDDARVKDMASRGLVAVVSDTPSSAKSAKAVKEAAETEAAKAAKAKEDVKSEAEAIESIKSHSDLAILSELLELENSKETPRETVISAIKTRIAELASKE